MAYRELVNAATGTRGQVEACITALDLHDNPPEELEQLIDILESALQKCDTIITKGENEPEEDPATSEEAAEPSGEPETTPAEAQDPMTVPPIFED